MIKLANLYKKKDKNGQTYLIGDLNGNSIMIFENNKKAEDYNHDFSLFIREKKKNEGPRVVGEISGTPMHGMWDME